MLQAPDVLLGLERLKQDKGWRIGLSLSGEWVWGWVGGREGERPWPPRHAHTGVAALLLCFCMHDGRSPDPYSHAVCACPTSTPAGVAQAETLHLALQARTSGGAPLFDSVQATWNLLEQSAGAALLEAHQAGLDVLIKVHSVAWCCVYWGEEGREGRAGVVAFVTSVHRFRQLCAARIK